jgi:hypothetical protein
MKFFKLLISHSSINSIARHHRRQVTAKLYNPHYLKIVYYLLNKNIYFYVLFACHMYHNHSTAQLLVYNNDDMCTI